jgi:hypothetical protein
MSLDQTLYPSLVTGDLVQNRAFRYSKGQANSDFEVTAVIRNNVIIMDYYWGPFMGSHNISECKFPFMCLKSLKL